MCWSWEDSLDVTFVDLLDDVSFLDFRSDVDQWRVPTVVLYHVSFFINKRFFKGFGNTHKTHVVAY